MHLSCRKFHSRKVAFIGGNWFIHFSWKLYKSSLNRLFFEERKRILQRKKEDFSKGCLRWKWLKFISYSDRVGKINLNHVKVISGWKMFENSAFLWWHLLKPIPLWLLDLLYQVIEIVFSCSKILFCTPGHGSILLNPLKLLLPFQILGNTIGTLWGSHYHNKFM